jgi:hypothetical protein
VVPLALLAVGAIGIALVRLSFRPMTGCNEQGVCKDR